MKKFSEQPSKIWTLTLCKAKELLKIEGVHSVLEVFAEVFYEERKKIFAEKEGLKESKAQPCARSIAGKKCKRHEGLSCDCSPPGSDHASMWSKDGKLYMYVFHRYDLSYEYMKLLVRYCEKHKLTASIDPLSSWHFPGWTFSIILKKAHEDAVCI